MNNYREKFIELVRLSNLAPSSHNSQPWMVTELAGDVWGISLHPDRMLKGLNAHKWEMLISLGGFIAILENLLFAYGIPFESHFHDSNQNECNNFFYKISLGGSSQAVPERTLSAEALQELIEKRYTDRRLHKHIGFEFKFDGLLNIKNIDTSLMVRMYEERKFKDDICTIVSELGWMEFTHAASWKELYSFIDFDEAEGVVDKLGFNIQQLIGPAGSAKRTLYEVVLHPKMMPISHRLGVTRYFCNQLNQCIQSSHAVVVITTKGAVNTKVALDAGKKLSDMWLSFVEQGIVLHPLSILLQHDIIKNRFCRLLPFEETPLFVARIGLPAAQQTSDNLVRYRKSIEKGVVVCDENI